MSAQLGQNVDFRTVTAVICTISNVAKPRTSFCKYFNQRLTPTISNNRILPTLQRILKLATLLTNAVVCKAVKTGAVARTRCPSSTRSAHIGHGLDQAKFCPRCRWVPSLSERWSNSRWSVRLKGPRRRVSAPSKFVQLILCSNNS